MSTAAALAQLAAADWAAIGADLDTSGCAVTPLLLTPAQCGDLAGLYNRPELFRSTIDMSRHRFGSGSTGTSPTTCPDRSACCARPSTRTCW